MTATTHNMPTVRYQDRGRGNTIKGGNLKRYTQQEGQLLEQHHLGELGGPSWAKMAKSEGHHKGVPKSFREGIEAAHRRKEERISKIVKALTGKEHLNRHEIASIIGLGADGVHTWILEAIAAGLVTSQRRNGQHTLYRLV